jgi:hypothetical protein
MSKHYLLQKQNGRLERITVKDWARENQVKFPNFKFRNGTITETPTSEQIDAELQREGFVRDIYNGDFYSYNTREISENDLIAGGYNKSKIDNVIFNKDLRNHEDIFISKLEKLNEVSNNNLVSVLPFTNDKFKTTNVILNIVHQSIKLEWLKPTEISNPKTLILGSFNPYYDLKTVDYYYGRKSNNFWKSIAIIVGKDENFFFDSVNGLNKKIEFMQNRFCCLDVINSIDFHSNNDNKLKDYLKKEIFGNFLDQNIWCTNNRKNNISLIRNYNFEVIEFLKNSKTIKKVIHTMGVDRITSTNGVKPKEKALKSCGFSGYFNQILNVCNEKNIEIVLDCPSPSGYLKSDKNMINLIHFYQKHLFEI